MVIVEQQGQAQDEVIIPSRRLADTDANSTAIPPTEEQIAEYQITLWTAYGLFWAMLIAAYAVGAMRVVPDSLLYAKFQSTRAQHKAD